MLVHRAATPACKAGEISILRDQAYLDSADIRAFQTVQARRLVTSPKIVSMAFRVPSSRFRWRRPCTMTSLPFRMRCCCPRWTRLFVTSSKSMPAKPIRPLASGARFRIACSNSSRTKRPTRFVPSWFISCYPSGDSLRSSSGPRNRPWKNSYRRANNPSCKPISTSMSGWRRIGCLSWRRQPLRGGWRAGPFSAG